MISMKAEIPVINVLKEACPDVRAESRSIVLNLKNPGELRVRWLLAETTYTFPLRGCDVQKFETPYTAVSVANFGSGFKFSKARFEDMH